MTARAFAARSVWFGLITLSALIVVLETAGAGQADPPVCALPYEWCPPIATTTASGQASAPVTDTAFNPLGRSYSYLTQGTTLLAIRNVADSGGAAGAVAWSWSAPTAPALTPVPLTAPVPVLLTTAQLPGGGAAPGGEVVFVGATDGFLYKLDAATGAQLGAADTRRPTDSIPGCAGGADGLLAPPTVQLGYSSDPAFQNAMTAAGHQGDSLVQVITSTGCDDTTGQNRVIAFFASDLTHFRTFNATYSRSVGRGLGACALDYASDTLYCGTDAPSGSNLTTPTLFALNTLTGQPRWSAAAGSITSRIVLAQGRLYVANRAGLLEAYAPAGNGLGGGQALWTSPTAVALAGRTNIAAAAFEGHVYLFVVDSGGTLKQFVDEGSSGDALGLPLLAGVGATFTSTPLPVAPSADQLLVYVGRSDGAIQQIQAPSLSLQGVARVAPDGATSVAEPALDVQTEQGQARIDRSATLVVGPVFQSADLTITQSVAQTFTPRSSGTLETVQLPVECSPKHDTIDVAIEGVSNGVPDGDPIAIDKVAVGSLPPFQKGPRFRSFDFRSPATLSAGTTYAIVLFANGAASCDVAQGPEGDSYKRGHALIRQTSNEFLPPDAPPPAWVSAGTHDDLPFKIPGYTRLVVADDHGHVTRLVPPLSSAPTGG